MNELASRSEFSIEISGDGDLSLWTEYSEEALYSMIVRHPRFVEDKEANRQRILEAHEKCRKFHVDGVPDYESIRSTIDDYNNDIFYNIALLNLMHSGEFTREEIEDSDNELVGERLDEEAIGVLDWFSYNESFGSLSRSIVTILFEAGLSFSVEDGDDVYEDINAEAIISTLPGRNEDYKVILGDCQNALFPEFTVGGFLIQGNILSCKPEVSRYV